MLLVCPAIGVPPVDTVYHRYCPAEPPDAFSVIVEEPQAELPLAKGGDGFAFTVTITAIVGTSAVFVPETRHR